MTRLFIALDVSEDIKRYLKELQQELKENIGDKQFKFVDDTHLTLLFLGETEDEDIVQIKDALSKISFKKFNLELNELGVFPNESYVKVVWLGVNHDEELMGLQKEIEAKLSFIKLRLDHKFHPHLTIARVRYLEDEEKRKMSEFISQKPKPLKFDVPVFRLYKSTLTREGPIYDSLAEFSAQ